MEPTTEHERRSRTRSAGSRCPSQSGIAPGSAKPEALKVESRVRFPSPSTENCGLARPMRVRRRPESWSTTTRPSEHWTPVQAEQGSAFLGQSRLLSPSEDLSPNSAALSAADAKGRGCPSTDSREKRKRKRKKGKTVFLRSIMLKMDVDDDAWPPPSSSSSSSSTLVLVSAFHFLCIRRTI